MPEPIEIDAVLARLILRRREHQLPRPESFDASYPGGGLNHHSVTVQVATLADVARWADALDIPQRDRDSHHYDDGSEIHTAWLSGWHGWSLTIRASIRPGREAVPHGLDADTVAALEQIAQVPA